MGGIQQNNIKICVLMPTYNNAGTLKAVIDSVLQETNDLIVVNDGSSDNTKSILSTYDNIILIDFPKNKGKGIALKEGFKKAKSLNYTHIITLDSDGQHFASDIPAFVNACNNNYDTFFIGNRNFDEQEDMPSKNNFANKFSNFWFRLETGKRLNDTQTGFRLYPLHKIPKRIFGGRYEWEYEILIRTIWRKAPIVQIPIKVYYFPEDQRVSHFKPFKDFFRISILNTILVSMALFVRPYLYFSKLLNR